RRAGGVRGSCGVLRCVQYLAEEAQRVFQRGRPVAPVVATGSFGIVVRDAGALQFEVQFAVRFEVGVVEAAVDAQRRPRTAAVDERGQHTAVGGRRAPAGAAFLDQRVELAGVGHG